MPYFYSFLREGDFLNPFIPERDVKCVLIDGRELDIGKALERLGIKVLYTERCTDLYEAISYHPDIHVHPLDEGEVVVAPNVSQAFLHKLVELDIKVIKGKTFLKRNYPYDIAYNVARLGNVAFHNLKYTDPVLREELEKRGVKFLHVNQGYTKCNIAIVDDRSFITSDTGILDVAVKNGFDVLLISPGGIVLKGFDYGFIGGATGLIGKRKLAFTGDFSYLKDYEKIMDFLNKKGIEIVQLTSAQIKDIGSIIPLF
ncbi:DUF6873 family GME fold protein [Caldanaerobacter sp.]|uniref:DUF6873 family GME fold protein n=1 Tax=Caldanaerobacter sp. TaxID=2930036 RepID=UPI003C790952